MMYLKTPRYDTMFKLDTPNTSAKLLTLTNLVEGNEENAAIFVQQLLLEH